MSQALLERAAKIKAHQAALASVPGSGYHAEDTPEGVKKSETRRDGRLVTEPTIDKDLIAFSDEGGRFYCYLVGDCAVKAEAILKQHLSTPSPYGTLPDDHNARQLHPHVEFSTIEGVPTLRIHRTQWNAFVHAMHLAGVKITETSVKG